MVLLFVYYILSNVIMSRVNRTETVGYTPHYTFVAKFISLPNIINTGKQYLMFSNSFLVDQPYDDVCSLTV